MSSAAHTTVHLLQLYRKSFIMNQMPLKLLRESHCALLKSDHTMSREKKTMLPSGACGITCVCSEHASVIQTMCFSQRLWLSGHFNRDVNKLSLHQHWYNNKQQQQGLTNRGELLQHSKTLTRDLNLWLPRSWQQFHHVVHVLWPGKMEGQLFSGHLLLPYRIVQTIPWHESQ